MTKMYCNWLSGLSGGTSVAEVQGQTFAQDAQGLFVAQTSKITFAPVNSCTTGSTFTVTSAQPSSLDGSRSGTKDLTTVGALGTIPSVTVPTYTIPSS